MEKGPQPRVGQLLGTLGLRGLRREGKLDHQDLRKQIVSKCRCEVCPLPKRKLNRYASHLLCPLQRYISWINKLQSLSQFHLVNNEPKIAERPHLVMLDL